MNFLLPETQNRTKTGMIVISVFQAMRMIFGESENDQIKIEDANLAIQSELKEKLESYAKLHRLLVFISNSDEIPFNDGIIAAEQGGYAGVICGRM
jgi:hypothetical protein